VVTPLAGHATADGTARFASRPRVPAVYTLVALARRRGRGQRPDRRSLHRARPRHEVDVGQTHVGTFWVWDARFTSELVLLFLYPGYMALDRGAVIH
jgi:hypothetical protein